MDHFDLGSHTWPISTNSTNAQRWFDQGLNWCFGFNREEGVKCFRKALESDPDCVMAHWGVAYGLGPFYNLTWRELGEQETKAVTKLTHDHVEKARSYPDHATDLENHLVHALARRCQ